MDKVESEATLDAKAAEIRRHAFHPGYFHHLVVLDMQIKLAAFASRVASDSTLSIHPTG
jgi:hypothetical protein